MSVAQGSSVSLTAVRFTASIRPDNRARKLLEYAGVQTQASLVATGEVIRAQRSFLGFDGTETQFAAAGRDRRQLDVAYARRAARKTGEATSKIERVASPGIGDPSFRIRGAPKLWVSDILQIRKSNRLR